MARKHESRDDVVIRTGEDVWPLFERAERVIREQTAAWDQDGQSKYVTLTDTGGSERFDTIADAKASFEGNRHSLTTLGLWVHQRDWERAVAVTAHNLDAPAYTTKRIAVSTEAPDEASGLGLTRLLIEEIKTERAAREPDPDTSLGRFKTALNHPWTIALGSALIAGLIILTLTIVLT